MTKHRAAAPLFAALLFLPTSACWTMTHTVGRGGEAPYPEGVQVSAKQWYILFGLVQLNHVDPGRLAGSATNYTVTTQQSFLDCVINLFTGLVSIGSRTVTVTR